MREILWGLGFLLFGIFYIWHTRKHGIKGRDILKLNMEGYIIGFSSAIMGIAILVKYFFIKH